jgi:hypothetical protein
LELAAVSLVELGVEDFRNLIFRFSIDYDWWRQRLFAIQKGVWNCWLECRDMEYRMYCMHILSGSLSMNE